MLELQEPGHVVDAGGEEIDLFLRHADVAGDQVHRRLHAVAEADELEPRDPAQRPAAHGHGVGVVEQERVGAELLHVRGDLEQGGDVPQGAEDAARPQRVADALVDAVLERDLVVLPELVDAAHLDHDDHVVRPPQRLAPVGGGDDRRVHAVVLDHALDERVHLVQPRARQRHQPILAAGQRRRRQQVRHQRLAEDQASRADHCDLGHGRSSSVARRCRVRLRDNIVPARSVPKSKNAAVPRAGYGPANGNSDGLRTYNDPNEGDTMNKKTILTRRQFLRRSCGLLGAAFAAPGHRPGLGPGPGRGRGAQRAHHDGIHRRRGAGRRPPARRRLDVSDRRLCRPQGRPGAGRLRRLARPPRERPSSGSTTITPKPTARATTSPARPTSISARCWTAPTSTPC